MRPLAKLLPVAAVIFIGGLVFRLRYGRPVATPGSDGVPRPVAPHGATPEAAEGDLLDEYATDTIPAADALSGDREAPEADALEQAQELDGEVLAHDLPLDDEVSRPDAADPATVVDDR